MLRKICYDSIILYHLDSKQILGIHFLSTYLNINNFFVGRQHHICANFGISADGGGLNLASNWQIIPDLRDGKHVIDSYIQKGLVFDDPRRPDLIDFYLQEIKFRRNTYESCILEEDSIIDISRMVGAPQTSFLKAPNFVRDKERIVLNGYYCIQIGDCEFFISSSKDGHLDITDVFYKDSGSTEIKRPISKNAIPQSSKNYYYELELTETLSGDMLYGQEQHITIIRVYFIRISKKQPTYELDQTDVYCIDGETKTITKCQIEMNVPDPRDPNLRILKDGRIILDDELIAPSFFNLSELWCLEKSTEDEINARSKRADLYLSSMLRREIGLDTLDWKGPNIGCEKAGFVQGADYARNLEALGRFRTGIADGYGNSWSERSTEDLLDHITSKSIQDREMSMADLQNPWDHLESAIHFNSANNLNLSIECAMKVNHIVLRATFYRKEDINELNEIGFYNDYDMESENELDESIETSETKNGSNK